MHRSKLAILLSTLGVFAAVAGAGDLNPPLGPVGPTMKSLAEVEPRVAINAANTPGDPTSVFRIGSPGSYYLTGSVKGEFGKHGIKIEASNVTIDLNGFDVAGAFGSLDGINGSAAPDGVTIRNGRIVNWGGMGIQLSSCTNAVVEDMTVSGNAASGIRVDANAAVRRCVTSQNSTGIFADGQALIEHCTASDNVGSGFDIGWGSHVSHCMARDNGGSGYVAGNGVNITDCASMGNTGSGFYVGEGSAVVRCTSYQDVVYGVRAGEGTTVEQCTIRFARPAGIFLSDYAVARGNTVSQTINDGIVAANFCAVERNTVLEAGVSNSNFGIGIRVTGTDTRVEDNQVTDCDLGMKIEGAGNLIRRNTSSGNTSHWDIAVNNRLAPIVVGTLNGVAVVGSSYGGNLGTTDPNANFTY